MAAVDGVVRVVPVQQGIVEADLQAFGAERVHEFPEQVAPAGGVGALVVGELGVPHAEAFVVLGGEDDVFHAGLPGHPGPFLRVEEVGVEMVEVLLVVLVGQAFLVLDPFVPGRHGIESPVDEHAEAGVRPPLHALEFLLPGLGGGEGEFRRGRRGIGFLAVFLGLGGLREQRGADQAGDEEGCDSFHMVLIIV